MKHTSDSRVGRSMRSGERLDKRLPVASFYWKADGILIELAEYTCPDLERAISKMRPGDPHYRKFVQVLRDPSNKLKEK